MQHLICISYCLVEVLNEYKVYYKVISVGTGYRREFNNIPKGHAENSPKNLKHKCFVKHSIPCRAGGPWCSYSLFHCSWSSRLGTWSNKTTEWSSSSWHRSARRNQIDWFLLIKANIITRGAIRMVWEASQRSSQFPDESSILQSKKKQKISINFKLAKKNGCWKDRFSNRSK